MLNTDMIGMLAAFSIAVWTLVSKTPIKNWIIKPAASGLFLLFICKIPQMASKVSILRAIAKRFGLNKLTTIDYDAWEHYIVIMFVAAISAVLVGIAHEIDMIVIAANLPADLQWIKDAEFVSAIGIISLTPVKFSVLYYLDLVLTVALITLGSATIHRLEKWISGNSLLADMVRTWLLNNNQAIEEEFIND